MLYLLHVATYLDFSSRSLPDSSNTSRLERTSKAHEMLKALRGIQFDESDFAGYHEALRNSIMFYSMQANDEGAICEFIILIIDDNNDSLAGREPTAIRTAIARLPIYIINLLLADPFFAMLIIKTTIRSVQQKTCRDGIKRGTELWQAPQLRCEINSKVDGANSIMSLTQISIKGDENVTKNLDCFRKLINYIRRSAEPFLISP